MLRITMKPIFLATVAGVLLAASAVAQARQSARPPSPSDPDAPVPALAYDSALSGHVRWSGEAAVSPDKAWRRANAVVAGDGGDSGPAKQTGHGEHAKAPAPQQAPASTPPAAHAHHHPTPAKQ
jgi:hypothetical protein